MIKEIDPVNKIQYEFDFRDMPVLIALLGMFNLSKFQCNKIGGGKHFTINKLLIGISTDITQAVDMAKTKFGCRRKSVFIAIFGIFSLSEF